MTTADSRTRPSRDTSAECNAEHGTTALASCPPLAHKAFELVHAWLGHDIAGGADELGLPLQRVVSIICETSAPQAGA
jgi:hypothetical protein